MLIDRALYLKPTTSPAMTDVAEAMSFPGMERYHDGDPHAEVEAQAEHRVAAYLHPGGYVPPDDPSRLGAVLDEALRFCAAAERASRPAPVWGMLAVDQRWLVTDPITLADAVAAAEVPIMLIPAHERDPLSTRAAVRGLVAVLQRVPRLAVCRTDQGGLGALNCPGFRGGWVS